MIYASALAIWQTVGNIVLFLVCLSLVVCLHEAGHLTVAKICKVYCFEYSIGFGPALIHKKFRHYPKGMSKEEKKCWKEHSKHTNEPKTIVITDSEGKKHKVGNPAYDGKVEGETAFSLRVLPLGGYVSMAGEDGNEDIYGVRVPKERTLNGVNHAKQIAIMLAGITMNFLLAYVLFLISYSLPQKQSVLSSNAVTVSEHIDSSSEDVSPAYALGLRTGDKIIGLYQHYVVLSTDGSDMKTVEFDFPEEQDRVELTSYISFTKEAQEKGVTASSYTYNDLAPSSIAYASQDLFYSFKHDLFTRSDKYKGLLAGKDSIRTFTVTYISASDQQVHKDVKTAPIKAIADSSKSGYYRFNYFGISPSTSTFHYSANQVFSNAGYTFSQLFVGLYTALGSVFTPAGWKNVGGIISVYRMSAQGTSSGSLAYFLLLWGYISLDLACFNLLPFPGLDGWQTLLALIESIFRKKVPAKFKNVANSVGLIVMLILAGLLIVKDIIVRV